MSLNWLLCLNLEALTDGAEGMADASADNDGCLCLRISHGSNKCVIDSNNNDTESPEDLPEEQALQLKVKDCAMPIKGKSKTAKKRTC